MHNPERSHLPPNPDLVTRAVTSDGFIMRPPSSAPEVQLQRPVTAPISLSQMLPPKRELPFPAKKEEVKALPKEPDQQLLSSSLDPLQRKTTPPKTVKKRKSRAKTTIPKSAISSSLGKGKAKAADPISQPSPPGNSGAPSQPEPNHILAASENLVPTSDTLMLSGPPLRGINEQSTEPGKAPEKTSKKVADKKKILRQTPRIFEDTAPDEIMDRLDQWVRKHQDLTVPKQPQTVAENLAAYAAQPEKTRLAVIDDMIVECLGDDNFIKLVEDVDKSWKRIGLGF